MPVLPKVFAALLALACLASTALADDTKAPPLTVLQTVAYPDDHGDYTIRLGGWSAFAASNPQPYNPTLTLRLADDTLINLCDAASTGPCFQRANHDDVLTITLKQVWPRGGAPVLMFHSVKDGTPDVSVPLKVVFSPYGPDTPRLVAAVATILLLGIAAFITNLNDAVRLISGHKVNQLRALFINKATASYSLSKVQLYVWMIASISTYIYLMAARILVQGEWNFINVPQSVVAVALISVSTSVLSSGVTSVNGGPGSGKFGPSGADLITSGGDVAPERVQQLLWTLLGAPMFVILAYHTDPAVIDNIQEVPSYFLQLMGVSSAGYVGGMIARGPGPKVTGVTPSFDAGPPPFLTLVVTGSDIQTQGASYYLTNLAVANSAPVQLPQNLGPMSKVDSSGIATELDLVIPAPLISRPAAGAPWKFKFTVHAADGEMAEWSF